MASSGATSCAFRNRISSSCTRFSGSHRPRTIRGCARGLSPVASPCSPRSTSAANPTTRGVAVRSAARPASAAGTAPEVSLRCSHISPSPYGASRAGSESQVGCDGESACKPDSVRRALPGHRLGGHPSLRPTWRHRPGRPSRAWPCSGWGLPSRRGRPRRWCALTAPFHPCLCGVPVSRCPAIGGLLSVALNRQVAPSWLSPAPVPCGVRTFLDPAAGATGPRPPGRLTVTRPVYAGIRSELMRARRSAPRRAQVPASRTARAALCCWALMAATVAGSLPTRSRTCSTAVASRASSAATASTRPAVRAASPP
jgi:hypothetical protein